MIGRMTYTWRRDDVVLLRFPFRKLRFLMIADTGGFRTALTAREIVVFVVHIQQLTKRVFRTGFSEDL